MKQTFTLILDYVNRLSNNLAQIIIDPLVQEWNKITAD